MKVNFHKPLSSYVTTIVLLLIYAVALAAATFIEKYHGTATAKTIIYYSPLFFLLQLLMVINFVAIVIKRQYLKNRKWGMLVTHFAFIIIFLGAFTSFLFSEEGILHLREGETSNQITVRSADNNTSIHTLPFSVELKKFTLTRYPGSSSPSSYESEVVVHVDGETRPERIFMNNVLDVKGYRFFLMIRTNKVRFSLSTVMLQDATSLTQGIFCLSSDWFYALLARIPDSCH